MTPRHQPPRLMPTDLAQTRATSLSPVSGMRGGHRPGRSPSEGGSAVSLASLVGHSQDAQLASADPSRWSPSHNACRAIVGSRSGVSGCCATSDIPPARRPSSFAPGSRADLHPVRYCSGLRRSRNRECMAPPRAGGGTCRRQDAGPAESSRVSSPPKWSALARPWLSWRGSRRALVPLGQRRSNSLAVIPPLTLTLSPLRGEGINSAHRRELVMSNSASDRRFPPPAGNAVAVSPSPLNGERAGVRGGAADGATKKESRLCRVSPA